MFWNFLIQTLVAVGLLACSCLGLESPEPEVLLRPRNFNPHPYRQASAAQGQRGPVLFPLNPGDPLPSGGAEAPADHHPYADVARKHRIKLGGRFTEAEQENNINPRVYSGLANYAAKVLKKPIVPQHNGYSDLAAHKKNYAYSFATGDDFTHSQSQNAAATNGEYRVRLPDGRVQIVSYTADSHGYKADVTYAEGDAAPAPAPHAPAQHQHGHHTSAHLQHQHQHQHQQQHHQQQQPIIVQEFDYYDEPQNEQVTQLELPVYVDTAAYEPAPSSPQHHQEAKYQPEYVTIYPKHDDYKPIPHKLPSQYVLTDKVQIYPGNEQKLVRIGTNIHSPQKVQSVSGSAHAHDYRGPYSSSTVLNAYDGNVLVSTVAPPQYSQVYITTPKYTVVHGSNHRFHSNKQYYKRR